MSNVSKLDNYEVKEFVRDFYYNKLKFCGCGLLADILSLINDVLNIIDTAKSRDYEENKKLYKNVLGK